MRASEPLTGLLLQGCVGFRHLGFRACREMTEICRVRS